jgi:hypothetical protein
MAVNFMSIAAPPLNKTPEFPQNPKPHRCAGKNRPHCGSRSFGGAKAWLQKNTWSRSEALPWDSLHQLFGTMGNMNSGKI